MDLWLAPHEARARSLRFGGEIFFGFGMSPFGECVALATGTHLLSLGFMDNREAALAALHEKWRDSILRPGAETGRLIAMAFHDPDSVPLMVIGTPFQLSVWEFLRQSRAATTLTYGEVARSIGRPGAARAVGRAVGANPLALLIPCHRVISLGKLTGYSWGLDRKKALLAWELARRDPLEMPF
jgi:AraC family transcriptional regulator of adaptative response/methylated-DNA-[protein]-cysteine methyltransferase